MNPDVFIKTASSLSRMSGATASCAAAPPWRLIWIRPSAYFTMRVPVMDGCMEQWYATVPAVVKVWV